MLTVIVIIILLNSFYTGYRRGLMLQLVRLVGYAVTVWFAISYSGAFARYTAMFVPFPALRPSVELALYDEEASFWVDQAFYKGLTFLAFLIIGFLLTNFIAMLFKNVKYYENWHAANRVLGALLNVIVGYGMVFILLFLLSLVPIEFIQQQFVDNPVAYWIVSQTPVLSDAAMQAWVQIKPF